MLKELIALIADFKTDCEETENYETAQICADIIAQLEKKPRKKSETPKNEPPKGGLFNIKLINTPNGATHAFFNFARKPRKKWFVQVKKLVKPMALSNLIKISKYQWRIDVPSFSDYGPEIDFIFHWLKDKFGLR